MELLLTALTLLATVYALLPRDRRLDLRLKLRPLDWAAIVFGSLGIMYLEFYEFFLAHGWVFNRPWPQGINAKNTAYLIFVVVSIFVWFRIFSSKLTRKNIRKFGELSEALFWSESYAELLALMHRHHKELFRIYSSDFAQSRWRNRLMHLRRRSFDLESLSQSLQSLDLPESSGDTPQVPKMIENKLLRRAKSALVTCASPFANLLPDYEESKAPACSRWPRTMILAQGMICYGVSISTACRPCREPSAWILNREPFHKSWLWLKCTLTRESGAKPSAKLRNRRSRSGREQPRE